MRSREDIVRRVVDRWALQRGAPPSSRRVPSLPVGLVSSLSLGDRVRAMDGAVLSVTSVGPGALVLEGSEGCPLVFTNRGHRPYSWAYYAAPHLCWLL